MSSLSLNRDKSKSKEVDRKKNQPNPPIERSYSVTTVTRENSSQSFNDNDPFSKKKSSVMRSITEFLKKRPSKEAMIAKGILKDDNIPRSLSYAGNPLSSLPSLPFDDGLFTLMVLLIERMGGVTTEGVFRVTSEMAEVALCWEMFLSLNPPYSAHEEEIVSNEVLSTKEIHCFTSVLKKYIREFPHPLLPTKIINNLLGCVGNNSQMKEILGHLTKPQRTIFSSLFKLLKKIDCNKEVNRMPAKNLGIIFGPCLFVNQLEMKMDVKSMQRATQLNELVEYMITHASEII